MDIAAPYPRLREWFKRKYVYAGDGVTVPVHKQIDLTKIYARHRYIAFAPADIFAKYIDSRIKIESRGLKHGSYITNFTKPKNLTHNTARISVESERETPPSERKFKEYKLRWPVTAVAPTIGDIIEKMTLSPDIYVRFIMAYECDELPRDYVLADGDWLAITKTRFKPAE